MMKLVTAMFVCALALMSWARAEAETNLAVVCIDVSLEGKGAAACAGKERYNLILNPDILVRDCPSVSCAFSERVYRRFKDVRGLIEVCKEPKEPGSLVTSCGTSWRSMVMVPKDQAAKPPGTPVEPGGELQGKFEAVPATGPAPLDVTLTWDFPGLIGTQPCQAKGAWSGAKNAIGSETINDLPAGDHAFTMSCTFSAVVGTSTALVSWKPPYTNVDGTPLTDLAGFEIFYGPGTEVAQATQMVEIQVPGATAYRIAGLAAGHWVFGVKAYNAAGTRSVMSNIAVHESTGPDVAAKTLERTIVVKVAAAPSPTLRVVPVVSGLSHSPVFSVTSAGARSTTVVGFAKVDAPCIGTARFTYRSRSYYAIAREHVAWWSTSPTDRVAVACTR